jgi:hypothetical protein
MTLQIPKSTVEALACSFADRSESFALYSY